MSDAQDAARYRWLRDNGLIDGFVEQYESDMDFDETYVGSLEYAINCDRAIDQQMQVLNTGEHK